MLQVLSPILALNSSSNGIKNVWDLTTRSTIKNKTFLIYNLNCLFSISKHKISRLFSIVKILEKKLLKHSYQNYYSAGQTIEYIRKFLLIRVWKYLKCWQKSFSKMVYFLSDTKDESKREVLIKLALVPKRLYFKYEKLN